MCSRFLMSVRRPPVSYGGTRGIEETAKLSEEKELSINWLLLVAMKEEHTEGRPGGCSEAVLRGATQDITRPNLALRDAILRSRTQIGTAEE